MNSIPQSHGDAEEMNASKTAENTAGQRAEAPNHGIASGVAAEATQPVQSASASKSSASPCFCGEQICQCDFDAKREHAASGVATDVASPGVEPGIEASVAVITIAPTGGNVGSGNTFDEAAALTTSDELVGSSTAYPVASSILPERLTAKSLELGAWRARTLKAARPLLSQLSQRACADALGVSLATLNRLVNEFKHLTDAQLTPENCAGDFASSGRRSRWESFAKNDAVQKRLQELYLLSCGASADNMTVERRTGSAAATLDIFSLDPLCPPDLAEELKAGKQPKPLLNVIRRINDLHEQKLRGQKHVTLNGSLSQRRTLVEILADGSSVPISRGDWWVFDDMSDNLPHWWEALAGQQLLGRQGLYCYDIAREWIGVEKVGTVRDSYTAAIILRFLRQLMQTFGKPRRGIVFERSVWMANTIRGVRLTTRGDVVDEDIERPAMSTEDKALLQRGIEALGLKLHYTYTPRGKEIEGAFNYLQRIKPMMANRTGVLPVNIGRHAGEFEHAAKQVRRVRSESHQPGDLGFLHIEQSLTLDLQVMQWINERTARRAGRTVEPYPQLAPLTQRDLAVFLPEKRDLTISSVKVTAMVDGVPHDFVAPELFAQLGNGYRVAIAFDPSEPTLGAALYNRETSSANFHGWQLGEFMGWADYLAPIARFDWREGEVADPQAEAKRRINKQVRTAFGAVGLNRRVSTARDGKGNVATVTAANGSAAAPLQRGSRSPELELSSRSTGLPLRTRTRLTEAPGASEEDFNRQAARLAADEARANARKSVVLDD